MNRDDVKMYNLSKYRFTKEDNVLEKFTRGRLEYVAPKYLTTVNNYNPTLPIIDNLFRTWDLRTDDGKIQRYTQDDLAELVDEQEKLMVALWEYGEGIVACKINENDIPPHLESN